MRPFAGFSAYKPVGVDNQRVPFVSSLTSNTEGTPYRVNVSVALSNLSNDWLHPTQRVPLRALNSAVINGPLILPAFLGSWVNTLKVYPSNRFKPYGVPNHTKP